ncbi:MAG: hypothetical protein SFU21_09935 [Flavihumibacter sp.]|nr:hypothetical protein [Flavihumibacter sp.]
MSYIIIKKNKQNWSGKEFSELPAKIYSSFSDAVDALNAYFFIGISEDGASYEKKYHYGNISFLFLTEYKKTILLRDGKIRW